MRKAFLAVLLALAAAPAFAQTTNVTATVRDSFNIPYSYARVSAQLIPTGSNPTINGQQVAATGFTQADINGTLGFGLADNSLIVPANTQWQITVCETPGVQPPIGTGSQCFTVTQTISGVNQSLTTVMDAAAPALTNLASTTPPPAPGSNGQFIYNNAGVLGGTSGLTWNNTNRFAALVNAGNTGFFCYSPGATSFSAGCSVTPTTPPRFSVLFGVFDMIGGVADDLDFGQNAADSDHHFVLPAADVGRGNFGIANKNGRACMNDATGMSGGNVFAGPCLVGGSGSPETVITAGVGSLYMRSNGGAGTTAYVKQTGTGNTGWGTLTSTIASGATALHTASIGSGACDITTAAATGVLTTDPINASTNGNIDAVTGYVPLTTGMLQIRPYPTAGNVNFSVCNPTSGAITPGAVTVNWDVVR